MNRKTYKNALTVVVNFAVRNMSQLVPYYFDNNQDIEGQTVKNITVLSSASGSVGMDDNQAGNIIASNPYGFFLLFSAVNTSEKIMLSNTPLNSFRGYQKDSQEQYEYNLKNFSLKNSFLLCPQFGTLGPYTFNGTSGGVILLFEW